MPLAKMHVSPFLPQFQSKFLTLPDKLEVFCHRLLFGTIDLQTQKEVEMAILAKRFLRICAIYPLLLALLNAPSVLAGALHCDGADDLAIIPDAAGDLDPGTSVTVEAWIRLDAHTALGSAVAGTSAAAVLGQGQLSNAGKPAFTVSVPLTNSAYGSADIPLSTWTHLAGTFDGTDIRLYVDGVLVGTTSNSGTAALVSEVRLCTFSSGSNFMQGAIDEVRWWNTVRTPAEINLLRGTVLNGDEPGLVGYWRFEELAGQDIVDSSVQGNDGFLGATDTAGDDDPARLQESAPVIAPEPESSPIPALGNRGFVFLVLVISALGIVTVRRLA